MSSGLAAGLRPRRQGGTDVGQQRGGASAAHGGELDDPDRASAAARAAGAAPAATTSSRGSRSSRKKRYSGSV